jgi:GNAT superfamily N-acetyltransferase
VGGGHGALEGAHRNMVTAWRRVLANSPSPSVREEPGLVMVGSGTPIPLFNPAFVVGPTDDGVGLVKTVIEHYGSAGTPFVLYFLDELSPGLAGPSLEAGLVEHWQAPLMVLDPIPERAAHEVEGLAISALDASNIDDYADALAAGFGMPRQVADWFLGTAPQAIEGFSGFVAYLDGRPVATSGLFVTDDIAGVYNVATIPDARGKGVGAAVTWAAVDAGRAAGASRSILQASGDGEPVYARMGYATPTRYRQFEPGPT